MSADSNSTGVTLPYEKQAMRGDPMPKGLHYPDQFLYQALSYLYARYRNGFISKDQGSYEKKELLEQYRLFKHQWDMGTEWVKIIKNTDLARCEYRKNRTLENADALVKCIDGII